jgi:hypothetical protein
MCCILQTQDDGGCTVRTDLTLFCKPPLVPQNQNLDISSVTEAQCGLAGPVPPVIDPQGLVWVSCLGSSVVTRTALFNTTEGMLGPQCDVNIQ